MVKLQTVNFLVLPLLTLLNHVCTSLRNDMTAALEQRQIEQDLNGRWLVVDFDGTCSSRDTTPLLPKLAHLLDTKKIISLEERLTEFSNLEKEYFRMYEEVKTNQLCPRTQSLDEALEKLDRVSNKVTAKVSTSGVLKGLCVSSSDIRRIIEQEKWIREHVTLLPGCLDVLSNAVQKEDNPWKLGVLSINWCPPLIEACLLQPIWEKLDSKESRRGNSIPIWSNMVDENGVVTLNVPGALAKREQILNLLEKDGNKIIENNFTSRCVIFVGDSSTDLSALVTADIGILIRGSKSTGKLARQFGVLLHPLTEWSQNKKEGKIVWTAESWEEIGDFLGELH